MPKFFTFTFTNSGTPAARVSSAGSIATIAQVRLAAAGAVHEVNLGLRPAELAERVAQLGRAAPVLCAESRRADRRCSFRPWPGQAAARSTASASRGPTASCVASNVADLALQRHVEIRVDRLGVEVGDLLAVDASPVARRAAAGLRIANQRELLRAVFLGRPADDRRQTCLAASIADAPATRSDIE